MFLFLNWDKVDSANEGTAHGKRKLLWKVSTPTIFDYSSAPFMKIYMRIQYWEWLPILSHEKSKCEWTLNSDVGCSTNIYCSSLNSLLFKNCIRQWFSTSSRNIRQNILFLDREYPCGVECFSPTKSRPQDYTLRHQGWGLYVVGNFPEGWVEWLVSTLIKHLKSYIRNTDFSVLA